MPTLLTLIQLREMVQACLEDVAAWCTGKPRLFDMVKPEQQIQFELACRLRDAIRQRTQNTSWDRLSYDASVAAPGAVATKTRPPVHVDTRQLFGVTGTAPRAPTEPDLGLAVHVLRSAPASVELDDNGEPTRQRWLPSSLLADGALLEERVAQLDRFSHASCDGTLFVVYSNESRRRTAVDSRDIASWASWQTPLDTLWWTARHFRAKAR
ncbi:MAG TPA: hypothetical protein VH062_08055 [Polyangiaceae bacterium]|jgi:hypothetical protein|nr:hypothetical protein [Polyangiaceae bacterium]